MRSFGTPMVWKKRSCSRGGMMTVILSPLRRIAVRDIGLPLALHHADQRVGAQLGVDLAYGHALQPGAGGHADVEQLDAPLGEGVHADRGREADQAGHHAGSGQLGVDDHGKAELVADEADLGDIFRVAHARDGVAARCAGRDQAGQKVDLIVCGGGDQQVGLLNARFLEHMVAGAAARYRGNVQHIGQLAEPPLGQVDQRQVVPLRRKLLGQRRADLAAAYNNDAHTAPPFFFLFP